MKARKRDKEEEMLSRAKLSKGLTKSNSLRHRSALNRVGQGPGHSDHELAHPVIAELREPVITGVQHDHDVIIRALKDLILLESLIKEGHFKLFELAERSGNQMVVETKNEPSVLGGVDDLGLEDDAPAASEETELCRGNTGYSSEVFDMNLERSCFQDSIREVGQVSGSFGGGA
jgi:hypothetical protein